MIHLLTKEHRKLAEGSLAWDFIKLYVSYQVLDMFQKMAMFARCRSWFAGEAKGQGGAEADCGVAHHTFFCLQTAQQRT